MQKFLPLLAVRMRTKAEEMDDSELGFGCFLPVTLMRIGKTLSILGVVGERIWGGWFWLMGSRSCQVCVSLGELL
jgi:hypothetical protein